jgi:hypothetical protein
MKPGMQRTATLEGLDGEIYLSENLLGYVISVLVISKDSVCDPVDFGLITFDEIAKRRLVAVLQLNKLAFGICLRYGRFNYRDARCV